MGQEVHRGDAGEQMALPWLIMLTWSVYLNSGGILLCSRSISFGEQLLSGLVGRTHPSRLEILQQ